MNPHSNLVHHRASSVQPRPLGSCASSRPAGPYRETLAIAPGRVVTLRPARHSDAGALQDFFAALSPRSRLLRFHAAVNRLPEGVLRTLTTQVPGRHVALVAVADSHDGASRLVAEARYVVDDVRSDCAEFALAVADAWQGLGLGRALLSRLAWHARSAGVGRLEGTVMTGNEPMLGLMRALGADLLHDGASVQSAFTL